MIMKYFIRFSNKWL